MSDNLSDHEIISTRVVNFPRELVFEAWSKPEHLAQWWGPKGFTNTVEKHEFKPGGAWNFTMHGPDGKDYENKIVYAEIVQPERVVLDHTTWPVFRVTATFDSLGERTRITFRQTFQNAADYNKVKHFAVPANEENFDRVEGVLATLAPNITAREIVISRLIAAPRERVYNAFTDAEHISNWWGPRGFTTTTQQKDVRPGGLWIFVMHGPDGKDWKNYIRYTDVVPTFQLAYEHGSDDQSVVHFYAIVTFRDEGSKTRVTLKSLFPNAESCETAKKYGLEGGKQTLERLEELLVK